MAAITSISATLSATICLPVVLCAQVGVGLGVGSGVGQIGAGAWLRESRLVPAVRYDAPAGFLRLEAAALERSGSLSLERAAVDAAVSAPAFGPLRFSVTGQFREGGFDTTRTSSLGSAVSVKHRGSGIWVGTVHDRSAYARLQVGLWQVLRSAIVSVSSRSATEVGTARTRYLMIDSFYTDTSGWQKYGVWTDANHRTRSRRWSDVQARLDWSGGRVALGAAMTRSFTTPDTLLQSRSSTWGSVTASVLLTPRVSLVATAGTLPAGIRNDASRSRFATVGLRVASAALLRDPPPAAVRPTPSLFRILPVDAGVYRVVLRSPGARTVELSGDFNQWKVLALTQTSPDVWEITLPLAAGTYRVNVRVNGDSWTAPPGLPTVNDEFNGRVGLLVVK